MYRAPTRWIVAWPAAAALGLACGSSPAVAAGVIADSSSTDVWAPPPGTHPRVRFATAEAPVVVAQPGAVYTQPGPVYTQPGPVYTQPGPVYMEGTPGVETCPPEFDPYATCPCQPQTNEVWGYGPGIFGEFLYLHPRDLSVPFSALLENASVLGPIGVADLNFSPGFRLGGLWGCGDHAVSGEFTWYESQDNAAVTAQGADVIVPLVLPDYTFSSLLFAQQATTDYRVSLQAVDADYHQVIDSCNDYWFGYFVGAAAAHLKQEFQVVYQFAPPNGNTTVNTDIDFKGIGPRAGLEGERQLWPNRGVWLYGHGLVEFLVGKFEADYDQVNQFNGVEVDTSLDEDRIVPVVELEAGLRWISPQKRWRISAGYLVSAWFNTVTTPGWIEAVKAVKFNDLHDRITFDGLTARAQWRW